MSSAMHTDTKNDFSKGSVIKNILNLALPMTLAQLINVLYNIVDRIYMGGAPLCSIERGRGNDLEAEAIMGNSFVMMVLSGLILTILGLILKRPMLYLFGASDETIPYADSYITIYLLGSIFVMTGLGMNSFINSQGFGKIGMLTVLLGAVTNIILDPLFIFTFRLGVQGAAWATIISQGLSAAWIIWFLTGDKAILKLRKKAFRLKPGRILAIGADYVQRQPGAFRRRFVCGDYDRHKFCP